jgi:hypothetical protein
MHKTMKNNAITIQTMFKTIRTIKLTIQQFWIKWTTIKNINGLNNTITIYTIHKTMKNNAITMQTMHTSKTV